MDEKLRSLLTEAGVETEEYFYSAYDTYQEKVRLKEQIFDIEAQIAASGLQQFLEELSENEIADKNS